VILICQKLPKATIVLRYALAIYAHHPRTMIYRPICKKRQTKNDKKSKKHAASTTAGRKRENKI